MRPMTPEIRPLMIDLCPKLQMRVKPRSTRAKSSGAPNRRANLAIAGAINTRHPKLNIPPKNDEITAVPMASPALPFFAIS